MEKLKAKVNEIFGRIDKLKSKEHEAALSEGYLKTFGIDGQEGEDDLTINNIKANLGDLINSQKKPFKIK